MEQREGVIFGGKRKLMQQLDFLRTGWKIDNLTPLLPKREIVPT